MREHSFSFLDLPVEVRLQVYRSFFSGQPRSITCPNHRPVSFIAEHHWKLLLISRGIYHEALPEYYRTCMFVLYTLELSHLEKLIHDTSDSHFARHVAHVLVWKVPEPQMFQAFQNVKWVKSIAVTCGVKPDPSNGQIFTYNSLLTALHECRIPGFSWDRFQALFSQHSSIEFMLDMRCDVLQVRLDATGYPQRKLIKTNFVYDVRADEFVEDGSNKQDPLILRAPKDKTVGFPMSLNK